MTKRRLKDLSEISSRRVYYLIALAIIAIAVVSSVALTRPLPASSSSSSSKTIQVTGSGTLSAPPDQAVLYLAVETQASTATAATTTNAAAMTKVINALTAAGISNSSMQTTSYTLNPVYSNSPNQSVATTIIGYDAINSIQVTLTNLGSVGQVLDQAIAAGANQVQGITFTLSNAAQATLQKQALQLAMQDADSQAKATAAALGVTIVGPISVSPSYVFQPVSYNRYSALAASSTPVQPGTLQVTVTVQVTYQFS
jgi:uncharacterized protein YggE